MTVVGNFTQMVAAWWLWRTTHAINVRTEATLSLNAIVPLPVLLSREAQSFVGWVPDRQRNAGCLRCLMLQPYLGLSSGL